MSEKAQRNRRFSLRAMAAFLGVAPSFLSTILKGDKNLSFDMANRFATRLELNELEREFFCLLVLKEAASNPEVKEELSEKIRLHQPTHTDLEIEHFRMISDPVHFSVLCATTLGDILPTARNLSLALNRPQVEIELAIERLLILELIEACEDGSYRKVQKNPRVSSQLPSEALQRFHRATLHLAVESLETQTPIEKVIGSETFVIDEDQLEAFRKLSDQFFDRALALSKKSKKKEFVYHLGLQFFNLTPNLKSMRKNRRTK